MKTDGEMYYSSGTLPTRYTFTGQYSYSINTNEIGLLYYGARFYDPAPYGRRSRQGRQRRKTRWSVSPCRYGGSA